MKIDNKTLGLTGKPLVTDSSATTPSKPPVPSDATPPAATHVTLGFAANRLHHLEQAVASAPLIDSNKVAEIKRAIAEGRFQVNSSVVADRLISTVQDLISASKR